MCRAVSGRVPNDPLVHDNQLIRADHQGEACRAMSGKVPDDRGVPDDPLVLDDPLGT